MTAVLLPFNSVATDILQGADGQVESVGEIGPVDCRGHVDTGPEATKLQTAAIVDTLGVFKLAGKWRAEYESQGEKGSQQPGHDGSSDGSTDDSTDGSSYGSTDDSSDGSTDASRLTDWQH